MAKTSPPVPNPTSLTTDAIERSEQAQRDYLDAQLDVLRERLNGIDRATELLSDTVNQVPTEVTKEVTHLRELSDTRLDGITQRFKERDIRFDIATRENKDAVAAALASQKELGAQQDAANQKAIAKSEAASAETINKLAELVRTQIAALSDKIDDLKERVGTIESRKEGVSEQKAENHQTFTTLQAVVAVVLTIVGLVFAYSLHSSPKTPTVTVPTVLTVTTSAP